MSRPVIIVSALLPPHRGGLGDHTQCLAETLTADRDVTVLTSRSNNTLKFPFRIRPEIDDWSDARSLEEAIQRSHPDAIWIWQYVPHMYGRGGVNRALPRLIRKRGEAGARQIVIAHEIAADFSWRPHWSWYAWQHRRQWADIRRSGAAIAISTEKWLLEWRFRDPSLRDRSCLLPSPSNFRGIPRHAGWREQLGWPSDIRIIGFFGTLSAHKQLDFVLEGWRHARAEGIDAALMIVGERPQLKLNERETARFHATGYSPPDEVEKALTEVDLLALPFIDGVSERRSSLMAGLCMGIPIIATRGHMTGPSLANAEFLALADARDRGAFAQRVSELLRDDSGRRRLGKAGQAAYNSQFSWEVVRQRLQPFLGPESAKPVQ